MARNKVSRLGEGGLALLAAAACLFVLSGCGIETTIYYDKPIFVNNTGSFTLNHNTANTDSSFHGYELYYRVYGTQSNADADLAFINGNLQDTSSYSPATAMSSLKASRGFISLRDIDSSFPLFPISVPSVATTFTIIPYNNSTFDNWYYTIDSGTTKTYLLRNIGTGVSFNSVYSSGDADFSGTSAQLGDTVYIVICAVAYGFDFSSSSSPTIYSFPVGAAVLQYSIPN